MDAISFVLTQSPALGLSQPEEDEIGESLYETISNFPATSVTVKAVNFLAPWAGLIHTGSKIVWKRLAFISQVKARKKQNMRVPPDLFPNNERGVVLAPDPSLAN